MTARRNESVCGIIRAGQGTVREHIAVEVIAYGVTVERDQTVVGVIDKCRIIVCTRNIARRIVVEGLGRYNRIVAELLDSSRSDSAEIIISITQFGRIGKYLDENSRTRKCG